MSEEKKEFAVPHTITLDFPIEFGKETINEVTIPRRLKTKDLAGIPDNAPSVDRTIKIASRLTGQVSKIFEELDPVDFRKVSEVIESFLPHFPQTGEEA